MANQQHPHCSSVAGQPTPRYLAWGLRMLSDVASHVQRCSRCYAVEEESEHVEGGWSIATPNGINRTSIVDNPVYRELTESSSYYCLRCFEDCFGGATAAKVVPPEFRVDLPPPSTQPFLTDKVFQRIHEDGTEMRPITVQDDNSYPTEALDVIPYTAPGYEGLQRERKERSDLLISVPHDYLDDLKTMKAIQEVCNEKAVEMKSNEENIENGVTLNNKKKNKQSGGVEIGNRCSRINGRGWQCRKTTLHGHALCDYHLALARTRAMENKSK